MPQNLIPWIWIIVAIYITNFDRRERHFLSIQRNFDLNHHAGLSRGLEGSRYIPLSKRP